MRFALTTHWNSGRHASGEAIVEEILALGIDRIELGYDLTMDLVPGIQAMVAQKAVTVQSVHNFCPVPVGVPRGHPELWLMTSRDRKVWQAAVMHTERTIRFAAQLGARVVVVHAGQVDMRRQTPKLIALCQQGKQYTPRYDRTKIKLQLVREKKAGRHLELLHRALDQLLPVLKETGIRLAIENLPSWESVPTEAEAETLFRRFDTPHLCYWHDIGHGQVRENLGFIGHVRWLEKLRPHLAGVHIHDVAPPAFDHLMPPRGKVKFDRFKNLVGSDTIKVFEPAPGTPAAEIRAGMAVVQAAWETKEGGTADER